MSRARTRNRRRRAKQERSVGAAAASGVAIPVAGELRRRRAEDADRLGIVDLGANTARLVVFNYKPGRWFRLVDAIREPIRLAEQMGPDRRLQPVAMERAQAAIELFADYARATALERIEVVATSAVRDASNRDAFLKLVEPIGLPIRVLTGEEEASYGVTAVANGLTIDDAWVMDLGGGSVQLSRMRARRFVSGQAFPLGAVRLTEAFFAGRPDPPKKKHIEELEEAVKVELDGFAEQMRNDDCPLVALGGTVRNLAQIIQERTRHPLPLLHGYELRRDLLEETIDQLAALPVKERARIPGLNPDRADVILAGALVFGWLLKRSGRDRLLISGHGVREGAFYRQFLEPPHLLEDVRAFGVQNVFAHYPQPQPHTARVRQHSLRLFDELAPLHRLAKDSRELLDAAAVLHDIGMTVGYYQHHRHGAMLLNSGSLLGFDHREQALISLLIRYHRKGSPSPGTLAPLLLPEDGRRLKILATILRLAEQLERSRTGRIRALEIELRDGAVALALVSDTAPAVELWEAGKQAELFEDALGRRLELRWRVRS